MSLKKSLLFVLAGLMMLSFVGCASETQPAPAEAPAEAPSEEPAEEPLASVTLRFANYFPEGAGPGQMGLRFIEGVERVTDGRVSIEYYPGGMLIGPGEMYDGVVEGIADIGFTNVAYNFGRFRESELLDLPLGFPNAWVANRVVADFYDKYQPEEWNDVHVITFQTSPVNTIITQGIRVQTPADLRGLTLRGTGYISRLVEAFGAAARDVAMPDAYDYLERGVIDGLLIPYETVNSFAYGEVTDHALEVWELGQVYTFFLVANNDSWSKISPQDQEAIASFVEDEFRETYIDIWNSIDIGGKQFAIDAGYTISTVPESELPEWRAMADTVIDEYLTNMVSNGYDEAELREKMDFVRERIDYWLERQVEAGVKSSTGPPEVRVEW